MYLIVWANSGQEALIFIPFLAAKFTRVSLEAAGSGKVKVGLEEESI